MTDRFTCAIALDRSLDEERVMAVNDAIVDAVDEASSGFSEPLTANEVVEGLLANLCVLLNQVPDEATRFKFVAHITRFVGKNCGIPQDRLVALVRARGVAAIMDTIGETAGHA